LFPASNYHIQIIDRCYYSNLINHVSVSWFSSDYIALDFFVTLLLLMFIEEHQCFVFFNRSDSPGNLLTCIWVFVVSCIFSFSYVAGCLNLGVVFITIDYVQEFWRHIWCRSFHWLSKGWCAHCTGHTWMVYR